MIFGRLWDIISPPHCMICGRLLNSKYDIICPSCDLDLPRVHLYENFCDNTMARLFWGKIPVERAAALFHYHSGTHVSRAVMAFKYFGHYEVAQYMGRMVAETYSDTDFFDGIDTIVPVPLTSGRQKERGYNQSFYIAKGIAEVTSLPILDNVVERTIFMQSQTKATVEGRLENVEGVFQLREGFSLSGKHVLLVDDVVTTGATISSCGASIAKCGDVRISVLSLGFAANY